MGIIGMLVFVIGATFGLNRGYGINPARDLVPRIFTAIAGWKSAPFTTHSSFFWIPIVAQLAGGVVGAVVYILTIVLHRPKPLRLQSFKDDREIALNDKDTS